SNALAVTIDGKPGTSVSVLIIDANTTPPALSLTQPANGAYFNSSPAIARGTVGSSATGVSVNGTAAALSGATFSASVSLHPLDNAVVARSTDACGNSSSVCNDAILWTTPPAITI